MAATAKNHLPGPISPEAISQLMTSIRLPVASKIESLTVTAEFHSIYLVHFEPPSASAVHGARAEADGSVVLVLRVSGRHLPRVKTLNEVGMMTWIRENTTIPVPAVIRFDASESNPIGFEYTLLERAPGRSVDCIFDTLSDEAKSGLVAQLADYLIQLHGQPREPPYVGGLVPEANGLAGGPIIDETFWFLPDMQKYWGADVTLESINPLSGPFEGYASHCTACLERYIHAIEVHPSLSEYREMIPKSEISHPSPWRSILTSH